MSSMNDEQIKNMKESKIAAEQETMDLLAVMDKEYAGLLKRLQFFVKRQVMMAQTDAKPLRKMLEDVDALIDRVYKNPDEK